MTHYFFHLRGPEGRSEDLLGCELESVEAAYLEARRAALEISGEMLARQENPYGHRFEICDEQIGPVLELPFRELVPWPTRPWLQFLNLRDQLAKNVARNQRVKEELADGFASARTTLTAIRQTMEQPIS